MSVIIRLQGLPWSASAMDIRQYFQGLSIPDGGVHIVGGDRGDAFIAFGSDEDARQAMLRTNGQINGQTVQLLLSSKTEMQNVIALAREAVPSQAYAKQATVLPPLPPLATVPPTRPPNDHMHPVGPPNHSTFVPDMSVPPQRNLDYPNRRDFPPIPVDMHPNTAPPTNAIVPGIVPFPGTQPPTSFPNQPNMPRENYFVSPDQDNNTNRQNMEFRPPDGGTNDFQNRRPNFPPAQDPQVNDQRRFGNANAGSGFGQMRPAFHNFPPPDGSRNAIMPNTAMQPPDMTTKPPGTDIRPPYSTERREEDFGVNRGNLRPDQVSHHMPPMDLKRPEPGHLDYQQGPPRPDPIRHGAGPPIGKDVMNRPDAPRPNDSNRTDVKPDPVPHMTLGRNEPNRSEIARHEPPGRPDMGRHEPPNRPNMGRHEPGKPDLRRQEPVRPDMGRPDTGRNYPNRSDGVRHESRFDSPRHEPPRPDAPRTEHGRSNLERTESLRQETARIGTNRSDPSRPGSSGRPDAPRNETVRTDSGRSDMAKTDSARHDSGRSDSGRHDSKSESRHDSRSESSSRYDSGSRYESGRHDRHDRSRDEGSRYDRHERSREDGGRYDRRDNRRDSRYDGHYESGSRHEGRYDGGRYDSRHESGSRYESRNDSRHDSSRGSDKPRSGLSSREFDRSGRDEPQKSESSGTDQHLGGPSASQPESYKNMGSGNMPPRQGDLNNARKGRMDIGGPMNRGGQMNRGGPMNRGGRPKNEYGGDTRRDYDYGPPQHDQGFPGDGQRFGDRPPGHYDGPHYGGHGMNEECGMYEGKQNIYEENDSVGLSRGLLGDAPPGFHGTQSEPNDGKWDEGYGMRDDMRRGDQPREDYPAEWHNEGMNMRPPFPRPGSWNDMPPNQPPYPRNDAHPPFGRNDQYGRYDGPNRTDRGPPPGRMHMEDRNYGPPNEMNYGGPDPGMRPGNMEENPMRGVKRGHRESDLYIEVVGLPFTVGYRDVRRFFSGCVIPRDGLKIINNEKGRRAGNAFIKFATKQDATDAFKRHGNFMGNRYIEIYSCTEEVFENAVDSYVPKNQPGPPPNKVMKLDSDNDCKDDIPSNTRTPPKENEQTPAKITKDMALAPASDTSCSASSSSVIQVKGITLNATSEDLVNFLKDVQINDLNNSIVIEHDSRGKNTGIAYIEVASQKDCETALTFDGRHMGGRLIRIATATKKDLVALQEKEKKNTSENTSPAKNQKDSPKTLMKMEAKSTPSSKNDAQQQANKGSDQKTAEKKTSSASETKKNETVTSRNTPYYCVSLKGLPFAVTLNEIKEFFQGLNIAPRGIQIVYGKDGRTTGQAFVEFVTSTDCEKAISRDKRYIGKRYINVQAITKADMIDHLKQARQGNMPNNMDPSGPPFMMPGGKQYHYLRGENFPPSVSIGEILNFFRGYYPVPESIRLHYAEDNRPTGNSLIGFITRDEAMKAMEDLNRKPCRKNLVTLRLA